MDEVRCSVELRVDDSRTSPGRLYGLLLTYETRAHDRQELFRTGALHWDDDGIVLDFQHVREREIMRVVPEVRGAHLVIDAPLPDTQNGRDAATSIRNGTLRGLSVEFRSEAEGRRGPMREIRRGLLLAAGLVDSAAYGNSVEVRRGATMMPVNRERLLRWL